MKSEICRSREQYTGPTDVAENELKSQIMWLLFMNSSRTFNFAELNACQKKKESKTRICAKRETQTCIQTTT